MDDVEIVAGLKEVESRCKSNTRRLDEHTKRLDNLDRLVASVEVLATKQASMDSDLKEIKTDVKALTDKPGKRWDQIVSTILATIVGAVLGVLLVRLGVG